MGRRHRPPGALVARRAAAGTPLQIQADGAREALHVDPAGGVLLVVGAHLEVFTTAGEQVAAVYPTASGGYAALSAAGAVDGSDDAPGDFVARVARGDEVHFYDARLAWAADRVPDLVPRVLVGEDVPPPR